MVAGKCGGISVDGGEGYSPAMVVEVVFYALLQQLEGFVVWGNVEYATIHFVVVSIEIV
jgi:hypothetical protein